MTITGRSITHASTKNGMKLRFVTRSAVPRTARTLNGYLGGGAGGAAAFASFPPRGGGAGSCVGSLIDLDDTRDLLVRLRTIYCLANRWSSCLARSLGDGPGGSSVAPRSCWSG